MTHHALVAWTALNCNVAHLITGRAVRVDAARYNATRHVMTQARTHQRQHRIAHVCFFKSLSA